MAEPADVSDESSVTSLFAKVKAKFGEAHVLVNSAGSMGGGLIGDAPLASWWGDFVSSLPTTHDMRGLYLTHGFLIGDQCKRHLPPNPVLHS